jgi:hypothetical protein
VNFSDCIALNEKIQNEYGKWIGKNMSALKYNGECEWSK